ncbi:hypothetical protein HQ544_00780 [Candidatus Falkowbacteria bacterium]|nr:hypothetical protein [Candidatus Falkowbacteria bacterium]
MITRLGPKYLSGKTLIVNPKKVLKYRDILLGCSSELLDEARGLALGSVENVVFLETIEHMRDYQSFVIKIRELLKTKGKCICSAPFLIPRHEEDDYWRFTVEGLCEVFKKNGFRINEADYYGQFYTTIEEIIRFSWFGHEVKNKWVLRFVRAMLKISNFFDKRVKNKNVYTNIYVVAEKI